MLTPWGRVLTRTAGLSALQSLPTYKVVGQFIPRGLATATAPKKAATNSTVTKKATTTTTKTAKAPVKTTATSTTKKAASKTSEDAQKKTAAKAVETAEKPAKKPKKTEEEKQKEHIKSLLEKALHPPILSTKSPWVCFLKEKFETHKGTGDGVGALLKREHSNWSNEYKNLAPAQLEVRIVSQTYYTMFTNSLFLPSFIKALQDRAAIMKGTAKQVLDNWVRQHTPAQIYQANVARAALRHIKAKADPVPRGLKSKRFAAIRDDRYPLRARSPNILYVKEKFATLPQEKKSEALPTLMKEFATLPETEKQVCSY